MKIQCCACLRIRKDDRWETLAQPKVLEENVSHGYCPACAEKAFAELRAHRQTERCVRPAVVNF